MNNNLTEIIFILDRSGSMCGLESDTIGGYNSMIEKQRKEPGEVTVTTVLFDDLYEIIHDHADIQKIKPITEKEYYARGCTALFDAIGRTIKHVTDRYRQVPDNEVPGKTMVVITTDGYENASRRYSLPEIREMITCQKEKYHWEFLFLGANIDAIETAEGFGINADRAVTYCADRVGTQINFEAVNNAVGCMRADEPITESWKAEIEEYRKSK